MPGVIRPNHNQRSNGTPVDDEIEAVITVQYVRDPATGEFVVLERGGGTGESVFVRRNSGATINPATEEEQLGHNTRLDAANASLDLIEAYALTLRDTVLRRTDPVATGSNIIGHVSDAFTKKVAEGKARIAGSGRLTINPTSPNASMQIANPTGNARIVYIAGFTVYTTAHAEATLFSGTTSTGGIQTAYNPNGIVAAPVSTEIRAGVGALSGGTQLSPAFGVNTNDHFERFGILAIIPQSGTRAVSVTALDLASNASVWINVYYYEE